MSQDSQEIIEFWGSRIKLEGYLEFSTYLCGKENPEVLLAAVRNCIGTLPDRIVSKQRNII